MKDKKTFNYIIIKDKGIMIMEYSLIKTYYKNIPTYLSLKLVLQQEREIKLSSLISCLARERTHTDTQIHHILIMQLSSIYINHGVTLSINPNETKHDVFLVFNNINLK